MNTQEYTSDRIRRIQSAQNTVKYVCIVGIHKNTTTIFGGEYTRIWGETPLLPTLICYWLILNFIWIPSQ